MDNKKAISNQQSAISEKKKETAGLACGKCGCRDLQVTKTEKVGRFIRRRRECRHCGKVKYTREREEE